jgi:hypothetical protein
MPADGIVVSSALLLSAAKRKSLGQDGVWATPSLASLASPPHEGEIYACNSVRRRGGRSHRFCTQPVEQPPLRPLLSEVAS